MGEKWDWARGTTSFCSLNMSTFVESDKHHKKLYAFALLVAWQQRAMLSIRRDSLDVVHIFLTHWHKSYTGAANIVPDTHPRVTMNNTYSIAWQQMVVCMYEGLTYALPTFYRRCIGRRRSFQIVACGYPGASVWRISWLPSDRP